MSESVRIEAFVDTMMSKRVWLECRVGSDGEVRSGDMVLGVVGRGTDLDARLWQEADEQDDVQA